MTDVSIEHLIIHANNATLGTAELVAGVSVGNNPAPAKLRGAIDKIDGAHARLAK